MPGEGLFLNSLQAGNLKVSGSVDAKGANMLSVKDLITTASLTKEDSGKLITLGLAGGFTVTLPRPVAGVKFTFVVKVAPTTAYIIVAAGSANIIHGCLISGDMNAAADTGAAAASDTITFVANIALIGNRVELECDGTYWYAKGYTTAYNGITFTQAS